MSETRRPLDVVRPRRVHREFVVYAGIGLLTQAIDIGLFAALIAARLPLELAATISICVATATHFVLNKYLNFRNHDRRLAHQVGTYLAVCAVSFCVQLSIVSICARVVLLSPIAAKLIGNASGFPINFLMHRYLTFGRGIRGAFAAWRQRKAEAST